ncbi:hypothetical protein T4B_7789 [Trichinella pseudospiralis]|uniref:Uncharacterized protein n=1 Tax=Trichinella pseudospiralis TaxID=6337 RepID=A0A0V1J1V4_TRIPS|nr:hypothetical protein T4C_13094 [Trichinella pseudospiralis]KRZ26523.1 hypothetical protein T4C_6414 [Trichinella pseudospiralis]KRZ28934.1 hypothetical protein T4B_7789 [Trichinella pseudospiralis]
MQCMLPVSGRCSVVMQQRKRNKETQNYRAKSELNQNYKLDQILLHKLAVGHAHTTQKTNWSVSRVEVSKQLNVRQLRPHQFETEKCLLPYGGNVPADPLVTDPIIDHDTRWHVANVNLLKCDDDQHASKATENHPSVKEEPCRFFLWSNATPVVQDNAVPAWHTVGRCQLRQRTPLLQLIRLLFFTGRKAGRTHCLPLLCTNPLAHMPLYVDSYAVQTPFNKKHFSCGLCPALAHSARFQPSDLEFVHSVSNDASGQRDNPGLPTGPISQAQHCIILFLSTLFAQTAQFTQCDNPNQANS